MAHNVDDKKEQMSECVTYKVRGVGLQLQKHSKELGLHQSLALASVLARVCCWLWINIDFNNWPVSSWPKCILGSLLNVY